MATYKRSILFYCLLAALSGPEAESTKRCFAPVVCNEGGNAKPDWMQVYPFTTTCSATDKVTGDAEQPITGPAGQPGPQGPPGKPGSPGRMNDSLVKSLTQEVAQLRENEHKLTERIEILNDSVAKLTEENKIRETDYETLKSEFNEAAQHYGDRLDQLAASLYSTQDIVMELKYGGLCNFTYQGKCFFGIFRSRTRETVNYQQAQELCSQQLPAKPANVYSVDQYNMLATYVRSEIASGSTFILAWLGMKANPSAGTYTLSTGEPASYINWRPGWPLSDSLRTGFGIRIYKDPAYIYQGMFNTDALSNEHGVICEI